MVSREMRGGLERFVCEIPMRNFVAIATLHKGDRDAIIRYVVGAWYTISPRPDIRDVQDMKVEASPEIASVTLIIRRGHYTMLHWLQNHKDVTFYEDGTISCSCHPDEKSWLLRSTLPNYDKQFEET